MRNNLAIILIFTILNSCSTKNSQPQDSFKVILPDTSKKNTAYFTFEHLKILDDQMDLDKIYKGVDSFEIRLWIVSMLKPNRMVLLKKSNQIITSQDFTYEYSLENKLSFKAGKIVQNNSYQILIDSLNNYSFENMLSQNEIEGFVDNVADGVTYTLEIATSKYYKLLTYHCPGRYADTDENNRLFLNIILLLDHYLHFYSPICSS